MPTPEHQLSDIALLDILALSKDATGVYTGEEITIRFVNDAMLAAWGKDRSVTGKTIAEALPELQGAPFFDILKEVWRTGKTYIGKDVEVTLAVDGRLQRFYFDFEYRAILDRQGDIYCILHTSADVTERRNAQEQIKEKEQREQQLNEELRAANEELSVANDEMAATNEEIRASNEELELVKESLLAFNEKLKESAASLHLTVGAANLGTWRMNAATREIILSPIGLKLYGLQNHENIGADEVIGTFVPQYQEMARKQLQNALERDRPVDVQYEIVRPDNNEQRWLRSVGATYTNPGTGEKWFYGAIMDITDQKQDEQRKNDFIGMVSHELKTPLTSLTGYLQMLQLKVKDSADGFVVNALEKSANQVKRMTGLINGFLNVTRLEAGKIYLDKKPFHLSELVQHLITETEYLQNSHIIHYTPCAEAQVTADREKIGSVISNLLSNALKYSPERGDIQVDCEVNDGLAKISVTDQGIGVKPEDQARLFDRFYRVSNQKTQTIAGFGIGLYLCAEIIKEHQGDIGVNSIEGQGSTFWFTLPLS